MGTWLRILMIYVASMDIRLQQVVGKDLVGCLQSDMDIPITTRGFMRNCCDVFPSSVSENFNSPYKKGVAFLERGDMFRDSNYILKRIQDIQNSSGNKPISVFVATADLPRFVESIFVKLPDTVRIVLVTGSLQIIVLSK